MAGQEAERVRVIDENIGEFTKSQLFFRLAIDYADSSYQLFAMMLADPSKRTFGHAQAAHFLFDHSLELFFKGAIHKSSGLYDNTHQLEQLHNRFVKLYPKKGFCFTCDINEAVKHDAQSPNSEFPRYPVDTKGNVWSGYNGYSIDVWKDEAEKLSGDLQRLTALIDPVPQPAF